MDHPRMCFIVVAISISWLVGQVSSSLVFILFSEQTRFGHVGHLRHLDSLNLQVSWSGCNAYSMLRNLRFGDSIETFLAVKIISRILSMLRKLFDWKKFGAADCTKKQKFRVDMSWWWTLIRIIVALFVDCIGWTYPFSLSLRFKILSFFLQIQLSDCVIDNNQQTKLFIFLWGYSLKIKSTNRFYCIIHAYDWIWWVN